MFTEKLRRKPVNEKRNTFWRRFNKIPRSLTRICMFIVYHGNCVNKHWLVSELVDNDFVKNSNSCKVILHRAIERGILVEDSEQNIKVIAPVFCVVKEVRGNVFDDWKILLVPLLVLTLVFVFLIPLLALVMGVVSLGLVLGWLREDSRNTYHY